MVHYVWQPNWTTVPRQVTTHYSGCVHEGVLEEIYISIGGLWVKQIALHNVGGPHPISGRPEWNKRLTSLQSKRGFCQQNFGLVMHHWLSLTLQPAGPPCRFWSCQPPEIHEPIPYIPIYMFYLYCFSEVKVKVAQSCLTLSPGALPNPGIKPRSPTLQVYSLPAEPQGKFKNIGVGSLFHSPVDLPDPRIKPGSPALQTDSLPTELSGKPSLRRTIVQEEYKQKRD